MQKVQMRRMNRRLLACGVAVSTTVVSAVTTNVWQGAATGGLWSEPGNWSRALTPTVETVYDFSALGGSAEDRRPRLWRRQGQDHAVRNADIRDDLRQEHVD